MVVRGYYIVERSSKGQRMLSLLFLIKDSEKKPPLR